MVKHTLTKRSMPQPARRKTPRGGTVEVLGESVVGGRWGRRRTEDDNDDEEDCGDHVGECYELLATIVACCALVEFLYRRWTR